MIRKVLKLEDNFNEYMYYRGKLSKTLLNLFKKPGTFVTIRSVMGEQFHRLSVNSVSVWANNLIPKPDTFTTRQ